MYSYPLHPTDLGIILSYRCQCACKHCLYNCGPEWDGWMSCQTLQEALLATRAWSQRFQIHFTGGEPFLNFPLLLEGVQMGTELGIASYAETNAGWCLSGSTTIRRFAALRDAGMSTILISCSPFHAESVPLARTLLAIEKAVEVFGRHRVIVYMPHCLAQIREFNTQETVPLERYVQRFGLEEAGRMLWDAYGIIPAGRSGYRLGHLAQRHPAAAFAAENCRLEILHAHHSHFDLYGNYISWFCGGLTVGDWRELQRLLDDYLARRYPSIIDVLVNLGPYALYDHATQELGYRELPEGYTGKCHLCVDVRKHLAQLDDHPELRPLRFYQMI